MKTLYLLIVLTQNGAGDINASFVSTESLAQCQQKSSLVEGVFRGSAIPVIESRCVISSLQFSAYEHALASSKIRNFYLVNFDDKKVQVSVVTDWRSCMDQQHARLNAQKSTDVYCASSVQSLL